MRSQLPDACVNDDGRQLNRQGFGPWAISGRCLPIDAQRLTARADRCRSAVRRLDRRLGPVCVPPTSAQLPTALFLCSSQLLYFLSIMAGGGYYRRSKVLGGAGRGPAVCGTPARRTPARRAPARRSPGRRMTSFNEARVRSVAALIPRARPLGRAMAGARRRAAGVSGYQPLRRPG